MASDYFLKRGEDKHLNIILLSPPESFYCPPPVLQLLWFEKISIPIVAIPSEQTRSGTRNSNFDFDFNHGRFITYYDDGNPPFERFFAVIKNP